MINQTLAPVTLFVYMRPKHTRKTLESLIRNELSKESILHVFAEGPKEGASNDELQKIAETRKVISELNWCGEVIVHEAERNKGLANSVIKGVSQIVTQYGKVIVLEDDLIISKGFLKFMNEALLKYEKEEKVMQISGHSFPAEGIAKNNSSFFIPMTTSWGWATWKRAWHKFDFAATGFEELKVSCELRKKFDLEDAYPYSTMLLDQMETKKIDSWAIRWWWAVIKTK